MDKDDFTLLTKIEDAIIQKIPCLHENQGNRHVIDGSDSNPLPCVLNINDNLYYQFMTHTKACRIKNNIIQFNMHMFQK